MACARRVCRRASSVALIVWRRRSPPLIGRVLDLHPSVRLKISVQAALESRNTDCRCPTHEESGEPKSYKCRGAQRRPASHMTRAPDRSRTAAHTSKGSKGSAGVMTVVPAYCTTAETAAELGGTIAQRVTGSGCKPRPESIPHQCPPPVSPVSPASNRY